MVILVDFSNVLLDVEKWELDKEVVSLLIKLGRRGYPLYLFTNVPSVKLEVYEKEFRYMQYFDGIIHDDRYIKPNPQAYERLEEQTGYKYEDMIFIDNSKQNIKVGESFGIKGILYIGVEDLRNELKKLNLL